MLKMKPILLLPFLLVACGVEHVGVGGLEPSEPERPEVVGAAPARGFIVAVPDAEDAGDQDAGAVADAGDAGDQVDAGPGPAKAHKPDDGKKPQPPDAGESDAGEDGGR